MRTDSHTAHSCRHLHGPLDGLRVVDATATPAGAAAAMHLADFGADVLRVARVGESTGCAPEWLTWHRNKRIRSVPDAARAEYVRDLGRLADVLIVDDTPAQRADNDLIAGGADRGDDHIHLWMPPTGTSGEWANLPADPILLAAVTAVASHQGGLDGPAAIAAPIIESIQGLLGACGAVAAVVGRATGTWSGRQVVVSGLHAVAALQTVMVIDASNVVRAPNGPNGGLPNFRPYRCEDGEWIFLAALSQPFFLDALDALDALDVMVLPGVDGEFTHLFDPEVAHRASHIVADRLASIPASVALRLLRDAGVPVAPVLSRSAWVESDTVRANHLLVEFDDPELGTVRQPPIACEMSATPPKVRCLGHQIDHDEIGWDTTPPHWRFDSGAGVTSASSAMPLHGVRVLDLGAFVASPFAASVLCDLGADVVKIEPPAGDAYRSYGASFVAVHQGKRGLRIDLKTDDGSRELQRLVQGADMVIHNFRPEARQRVGLEADELMRINDRLVVCELSAWGELGELRDEPAFDPLLQARSGLMLAQGTDEAPAIVRMPVHDTGSACMLALGGLAAIAARTRDGAGQRVRTSMAASSLVLQPDAFTMVDERSTSSERSEIGLPSFVKCVDGWIALAEQTTGEIARVHSLLGLGDWDSDVEISSIVDRILEHLRHSERDLVLDRLRSGGVNATTVLGAHFEYDDPFLASNRYLHTVHDPSIGPCVVTTRYCWFPDVDFERTGSPNSIVSAKHEIGESER